MNLNQTNSDKDFSSVLVGRSIKEAKNGALWLDNGIKLKIIPNEGGCSCGAGDYSLTALNKCDNIITSCHLVHETTAIDGEDPNIWRLFVFAGNEAVNAFTVEGDDGNGYYGTGFEVLVSEASDDDPDMRVRGLNDHLL